ncbi:hypothetical protein I302_100498 [Kwoniella bestiolae CBS 10118]|uniref:Flavin-nucleotide-binding protein n=1 Tax=Kwoniella bestiolae CBS 10118 TaxID=1296100 RepID=A0A1B9G5A4_9TREE|nr:hypothetical protein I302_03871 [Kwoniella bestiolae CBS 10118]OCF26193.1 hypothetical protein I302_03871 [Kwoniella bestiolae CBS 10118]
MTASSAARPGPSADIRLYKNRASYSLHAALEIFREVPVAHVAFVHPGDEGRGETVMNIPLITVVVRDDEDGDEDDDEQGNYSVYLHTHRHSGLVEAVLDGRHGITATTTKIDGMIFSPTAHDHTLNYRSATLHLSSGKLLDDEVGTPDHEEKRNALGAVTDTVTGYNRVSSVGQPDDAAVKRTTVIRFKIDKISCKQRYGGFNGTQEPELTAPEGKEGDSFTGVVPCWTQWGEPIGYGRDVNEVRKLKETKSREGREFAEKVAWANEEVKIEGLGKKRRQR